MDSWATTPDFLGGFAFVDQQHHTHYSVDPVSSTSQQTAWDMHLATDQYSRPLSSLQSWTQTSQNEASLNNTEDTQIMPSNPMGPPPKSRNPKAPTRRAKDWEPYKARILELHVTQNLPLKQVKDIIQDEFGFTAGVRQYRTRISQWGMDKNVKAPEMAAIVRKRQHRTLVENDKRELSFTVRGIQVEPQKIDRWMDRNEISENVLYAPSPVASTPSAVFCRTISDSGSLAPSPIYSVRNLAFTQRDAMSIGWSPTASSPALSVSTIGQSQSSHFTGQSPAPILRSLPNQLPPFQHPTTDHSFQSQASHTSNIPHRRFRQDDEDRLRRELSVAEMLFEAGHAEILKIQFKLTEVLFVQGRLRSAEAMIRRVIEGYRKVNENDSVNMLDALGLLGDILLYQGSHRQAHKLYQRTFESKKAILGEEHPSTIMSVACLLRSHVDQKQYQEAEELADQVLKKGKEILGQEHPTTFFIVDLLVNIYIGQKRWKEAEELAGQVVEKSKEILGQEHPTTFSIMDSLVKIYIGQKRWKGAEELAGQVLEKSKEILGQQHPTTLACMVSVTNVYIGQERWKEAEELTGQVMKQSKEILGQQHPTTLVCMVSATNVYIGQERWKEAEELGLWAFKMHIKVFGKKHPSTLVTMDWLIYIYESQGQYQKARELRASADDDG